MVGGPFVNSLKRVSLEQNRIFKKCEGGHIETRTFKMFLEILRNEQSGYYDTYSANSLGIPQ
jgi:hypothetical protein